MNDKQRKQTPDTPAEAHADVDIALLVEQIWHELQGQVSRSTVRQALLQVLPKYARARIKTYLPILIRRRTLQTLRAELPETTSARPTQAPDRRKTDAAADGQTEQTYGLTTGVVLPEGS